YELRPVAELLDHAEQVVPAPRVQAGRVRPELVEDLVHLERGEDRLDQHRRANRPPRDSELVLGTLEDRVPEPSLAVRLELRQIEVRPGTGGLQPLVVPQEIEAEVEERTADRLPVDLEVALGEVPSARADEQRRDLVVQLVD